MWSDACTSLWTDDTHLVVLTFDRATTAEARLVLTTDRGATTIRCVVVAGEDRGCEFFGDLGVHQSDVGRSSNGSLVHGWILRDAGEGTIRFSVRGVEVDASELVPVRIGAGTVESWTL